MIDVVSSLGFVKDCALTIKKEITALKSLNSTQTLQQLQVYEKAISLLQASIDRLLKVYSYKLKVPDDIALRLIMVEILAIQLLQFSEGLQEYHDWKEKTTKGCIVGRLCTFACSSASKVQGKLETLFEKCFHHIREVAEIEGKLLGTSMRIKHPIFQLAWLHSSSQNEINNGTMSVGRMQDALWKLLQGELGEVKNKDVCKLLIRQLVERMDGSCNSAPDGILSIDEINTVVENLDVTSNGQDVLALIGFPSVFKTPQHQSRSPSISKVAEEEYTSSKSIFSCCIRAKEAPMEKTMICLDEVNLEESKEEPIEEEQQVDCKITWISPFSEEGGACINHNNTLEVPEFPNSYGSGFKNAKAAKFDVHLDERYQLIGIQVEAEAIDQGWGGTKHAQIRYSVNDSVRPYVAFSIDRNEHVDNKYEFVIPSSHFSDGFLSGEHNESKTHTVYLWVYCPGWNAWECKLLSAKATALMRVVK
jgi:hypothetical protein